MVTGRLRRSDGRPISAVSGLGIVSGDAPPRRIPDVSPALPLTATRRPHATSTTLRLIGLMARLAPGTLASVGRRMLAPTDRTIVADPEITNRFIAMLRDAFRQGPRGTLVDLQLAAGALGGSTSGIIDSDVRVTWRRRHGLARVDRPFSRGDAATNQGDGVPGGRTCVGVRASRCRNHHRLARRSVRHSGDGYLTMKLTSEATRDQGRLSWRQRKRRCRSARSFRR